MRTIQIVVFENGETTKREIEVISLQAGFAVHTAASTKGWFTVTHIATGKSVAMFPNKRFARTFAASARCYWKPVRTETDETKIMQWATVDAIGDARRPWAAVNYAPPF